MESTSEPNRTEITLEPVISNAAEEPILKKKYRKNSIEPAINLHKDNLKTLLRCSNATPIRTRGSRGFTCYSCDGEFPTAAALKQHFVEKHSYIDQPLRYIRYHSFLVKLDITALCCKLCGIGFGQLEELMDHLKKDHGQPIHTHIKSLIIPFKFESEQLKCAVCSLEFYNFHTLFDHMRKHYRNFVCDICDEGYLSLSSMLTHRLSAHAKGEYPCKECDKIFSSSTNLNNHKRAIHLGIKRHKCGHCGEKFVDHNWKLNHMEKVHGIKKPELKCTLCDKTFSCTKTLDGHIRGVHLMERRQKCPQCEMTFFKKITLKHHMTTHTGQREFQCAVCLKSFSKRSTLKEHVRIHMNDRRFKCEYCGMSFVQKCSLKGHMRSKHGQIIRRR